jgi:hypothetical protein
MTEQRDHKAVWMLLKKSVDWILTVTVKLAYESFLQQGQFSSFDSLKCGDTTCHGMKKICILSTFCIYIVT